MKKVSHYFANGLTFVETLIYLVFTLGQYAAYYEGLRPFVLTHFNNWAVIAIVFFTYMFRLDILAAIGGFYGAWKIWMWPVPAAAVMSILFMLMSISVNYGIRSGMRKRVFRRLWSDEDTQPHIRKEDTREESKK